MGNRGGNSSEPLASSPTLYIRPRPPLRLSLPESFPQQAFSLSTYLITFRLPPPLNLFLHLSSRSNQSPQLIQNAFLLFRLFRRRRRRPQARRPSPADPREGSRPVSHQDWRCQVHLQSHGPPLAVSPQPQPAPPRPARADKVIQRAGTLFGLLGILRRNLVPSGERCQQLRLQQVDGLDRLSTGPQETMRGNPGNKKMAGPRPPFRLSTKGAQNGVTETALSARIAKDEGTPVHLRQKRERVDICGGRGVLHTTSRGVGIAPLVPSNSGPSSPTYLGLGGFNSLTVFCSRGFASWGGQGRRGVGLLFTHHHHHHGARERDLIFSHESHRISVCPPLAGLGKGGRKRGVLGREASTIDFPNTNYHHSHACSMHLSGVKHAGASRSRCMERFDGYALLGKNHVNV